MLRATTVSYGHDLQRAQQPPQSVQNRTPLFSSTALSASVGDPALSATAPAALGPKRSVESENKGTSSNSVEQQTVQRPGGAIGLIEGFEASTAHLDCFGRAAFGVRRARIVRLVLADAGRHELKLRLQNSQSTQQVHAPYFSLCHGHVFSASTGVGGEARSACMGAAWHRGLQIKSRYHLPSDNSAVYLGLYPENFSGS
jgi:hypothetical protein